MQDLIEDKFENLNADQSIFYTTIFFQKSKRFPCICFTFEVKVSKARKEVLPLF